MAVFIKKVNIPQKSDLINIDMTGSGTAQTYRVLKNVSGTIYEVMSMSNATSTTFDSGNTNTYKGKSLDTYLNSTWYNTLSATAKAAIVDKTFKQDSWYWNTSGNPLYQGKYSGNTAYQVSLGNASFGSEITRHAYAISVQDVLDYLEVTPQMTQENTTLTYDNVWAMFWNSTTTHNGNIWLRSAYASYASHAFYVYGFYGYLNRSTASSSNAVRPAFQIDLSKIDYTFTDGRQPVELKPVSILQKSNNTLSRVGMSWKIPTYPVKSDIVNIDMTGSGTPQQYRVLKVNGSVAEVLGMTYTDAYGHNFGTNQVYEGSNLDTYLNSIWYNTLSADAKLAIVDKTFRQDSWYRNNSGSPEYNGVRNNAYYQISLGNVSFGNELTRHCYALRYQDIVDYLGVTPEMTTDNTTLTNTNIWQMFWNSSTRPNSDYIWLSTADASNSANAGIANGDNGGLSNYTTSTTGCYIRPAFQIDLSKIDFTIE